MWKLSHRICCFAKEITSKNSNYVRNTIPLRNYVNNVDQITLEIPSYPVEKPQSLEHRKARLIYQSRKRGMLENDLLLSTFVKKYLDEMNEEEILMYDRLINLPSNDWDIYNWIIGKNETPVEFDNKIMDLLKEHAKNGDKKQIRLPNL